MIQLTETRETRGGHAEIWRINDDEAVFADHGQTTVSLSLHRETSAAHAEEFASALVAAAELAGVPFEEQLSIDCTLVAVAKTDLQAVLRALATLRPSREPDVAGSSTGSGAPTGSEPEADGM